MDKKIGISIYPEKCNSKQVMEYIEMASSCGIKRVFANLLEVDTSTSLDRLQKIREAFEFSKTKGMFNVLDIDLSIFELFDITPEDYSFFEILCVDAIRIDVSDDLSLEAQISKNIIIELNASNGVVSFENLIKNGGNEKNVIACHNFYPLKYTGLSEEVFLKNSQDFSKKGVRTAAFITLPLKQNGTLSEWGINDQSPSLEKLRGASISEQLRYLIATGVITDFIFAEQGATMEQMKQAMETLEVANFYFDKEKYELNKVEMSKWTEIKNIGLVDCYIAIEIEMIDHSISEIEKIITFDYPHFNRKDTNPYFIRSTFSRVYFKNKSIPPREFDKNFFEVGDVVVLNENYGRYKGELHIIKQRIENDGMRNYVGKIKDFDINILKFITSNKRFKIIEGK